MQIAQGKAGFAFSDALKAHGGKWDFDALNAWLTSPRKFANGTKMTFAGLSNAQDRANVIAYLNSEGSNLPLPAAPAAGGGGACFGAGQSRRQGGSDRAWHGQRRGPGPGRAVEGSGRGSRSREGREVGVLFRHFHRPCHAGLFRHADQASSRVTRDVTRFASPRRYSISSPTSGRSR